MLRSEQNFEGRVNLSGRPVPPTRQNECNLSSHTTSSPLLSPFTNEPNSDSKLYHTGLRGKHYTISGLHRGTQLVDWQHEQMEWESKREIDLIIESDASLTGWGATCSHQRTGGPWSRIKRKVHINCLELRAAILAVHTFAKNRDKILLLVCLDNTTAVAYINNLGGTVSKELVTLAKDLWMWCLERNIRISAQHRKLENDGPVRLEIEPSDFQKDRSIVWPTRSGPLCLQVDKPTTEIFQLETRLLCSNNRCPSPGLENSERICQSTLVQVEHCLMSETN